jgi:hypothetical protein
MDTVADSIVDVNRYANEYKIASSAPTSPSAGDLWYDTTLNTLSNYTGSGWASISSYSHPNLTGEVTSTGATSTLIASNVVDEANLKVSNAPTNGQFLSAQSAATGGMTWAEVDALPNQVGEVGKYLTTDGAASPTASWATLDTDANSTTKGLYEMANTIAANYSITSGNNALTAGPITINTGISVTIPTGSTWVIA